MKFISKAYWPEGVGISLGGDNSSTDTHHTLEAAQQVAKMLEQRGFGGDGEIFPLHTEAYEVFPEDHTRKISVGSKAPMFTRTVRVTSLPMGLWGCITGDCQRFPDKVYMDRYFVVDLDRDGWVTEFKKLLPDHIVEEEKAVGVCFVF